MVAAGVCAMSSSLKVTISAPQTDSHQQGTVAGGNINGAGHASVDLCGWSWFWPCWVVSVSNCYLCCFSVIKLGTEKCVCCYFDLYMQIFLEGQMCVIEKPCQCNLKIIWHSLAHLPMEGYYCLLINGSNKIVSFLECCHLSKHVLVMVTLPGVKLLKKITLPGLMLLVLKYSQHHFFVSVGGRFRKWKYKMHFYCHRTQEVFALWHKYTQAHFCNCSKCWSADTGHKIFLQLGCAGNVVK